MRFKASITTTAGVLAFQRVVGNVLKLSKDKMGKLRFTETSLHLIQGEQSEDELRVWAELQQDKVFSTFKVSSAHENNEILLGVNLDFLSRALKSATTSTDITLKLIKRVNQRYLSITIAMVRATGVSRPITQDVPIVVYNADEIAATLCPDLPMPEVNVYLPPMRVLKSVVERMKAINDTVVISTNRAGELTLTVETSVVSIKTYFKDLENPEWKDDEGDGTQDGGSTSQAAASTADAEFVHSTISIKALHMFLSAFPSFPRDVLMSVAKDEVLVLFVNNDDFSLTSYIPIRVED